MSLWKAPTAVTMLSGRYDLYGCFYVVIPDIMEKTLGPSIGDEIRIPRYLIKSSQSVSTLLD